jgi:IMP dehydrogenase
MKIPLGLSFDDVLLVPQRSEVNSRSEIDLTSEIAPGFFLKIPIIATKMETVTGIEMAIAMSKAGGLALMHRFDTAEKEADNIAAVKKAGERVFATVGARDDFLARAQTSVKAGADGLVFDVANGHLAKAIKATAALKNKFPKLPLLAGIVSTYDGAYRLFAAGADTVMVGIGAGAICTTRIMTGCGVPQITSLVDCVRAAKKFKKKFIIPDAGVKNSGDVVKALATGASAVICGSLMAGTNEAPGELIEHEGRLYKKYEGSTSPSQKKKEQEKTGVTMAHFLYHVEGVEGLIPYKGPTAEWLNYICAGVRSGFSYCGAKNIKQLWKKAKFIQITSAGMAESQAHTIIRIS